VLNLYENWDVMIRGPGPLADIKRARDFQGWNVYRVASWEELVKFAREFSRLRYGDVGDVRLVP